MQINISKFNESDYTECLILPVCKGSGQPAITNEFNKKNNNIIDDLLSSKDITGKCGECKWLYNLSSNVRRVLVVGVGKPNTLTGSQFIELIDNTNTQLTDSVFTTVVNGLADIELLTDSPGNRLNNNNKQTMGWKCKQLILNAEKYNKLVKQYKSETANSLNVECYHIASANDDFDAKSLDNIVNQNVILAEAIRTSKDLANMPPNICNPAYFEQRANELAKTHENLSCSSYSHEQLESMGMGAFCSVSQGSNHPGCMIFLEYKGSSDKSEQPYVLVGKGITFDTGGYTLKPGKSMLGMKYDMSGAASVFATMQAVAELKLPINLTCILACAENMIGHKSTRPNDIVTSFSGKSIEINNTDAEGRLVLCDAISYSEKFKPKVIIDVATLTGAAVVALGYQFTAAYTNQQALADDLVKSSNDTHDLIWNMPLCSDYDELLNNPMADMQNSSSMPVAGSITAACFLASFVPENTPWAHLDIAGAATVKSEHTESTGRPVPLLVDYLSKQAGVEF